MSLNDNQEFILPTAISKLTGEIPYSFKNDFMVRFTMQESTPALESLLASLLGRSPGRIKNAHIDNPISLNTDEKETIMDIRITLDDREVINIEVMTYNDGDWTTRSLLYLCRAFDHLKSGEPYDLTKPTLHVSIMDRTLFPDAPEFYARYALLNIKNGKVYSDKFTLNVLDLTRTDLATDEDRSSGLVQWAKVFQATTWEELLAVSKENPVFTEVIKAMVAVSNDKEKRILIEGRNNYLSTMNTIYSRLSNAETRADNAETLARNEAARADDLQKKLTAALEELKRYKQ